MRVLHLVDGSTTVGAITSIKKICNSIQNEDVQVIIGSYNSELPSTHLDPKIEVKNLELKFNSVLHQIATGQKGKALGLFKLTNFFLRDIQILNKFCKEQNIDIIHTHYLNDNFLASFLPSRIKKISHIRSIVNRNFFGGFGYKVFRFIIFKNSDLIIGISKTVLSVFNFPEHKKVTVIYNGISQQYNLNLNELKHSFISRLNPGAREKFLIGTVSRFIPSKGLSFLIDIIIETKNLTSIHYVVVAPENTLEEKKYKASLLQKIKKNGIDDRISFIGSFPNSNFFMPFFSILIHPTLQREGFGNVILEAHSAGIPVISTNCGGPSEVIKEKRSGYIVTNNSSKSFSEIIKFLSENPETLKEMGENAISISSHPKFNLEENTNKLIKLYHTLCQN